MSEITLRRWSEEEWLGSRAKWNDVLSESTGDPIFGSWEWQTSWWRYFGHPAGWELWLLAFERQTEIVGFFPAYLARVRRRGIGLSSVQLVGHHFRDSHVLVSEYLDVIGRPTWAREIARLGVEYILKKIECDEFVACCNRSASDLGQVLRDWGSAAGSYCRDTDRCKAYSADLSRGFARYLESIGGSTRRSLYLLRNRLQEFGPVRFDHASTEEVDETLDIMNALHATRWGEAVFSGQRLAFHREYADAMSTSGRLRLSRLWIGRRVVSVLYDVVGMQGQYNLQMGFDQGFAKGVSLGLLHLGYALEDAAKRNVARYDFLAGPGRRTQYKANLAQEWESLSSTQLLTTRWLAALYRLYDGVKQP